MSEKIIRDPVHDVIAFRMERPIDALLFRLLGADEVQRLRRVRQLGLAALAYPGADHSRYSHSLGVMETARRMLDQISHTVQIDEQSRTVCLVTALLHDLGHGPFSHVFERVSGIDHERLTLRIISDPDSDVHRLLASHDGQLPALVADFIRGHPRRTFLNDILSSQLDADRFDYLLRDNLMTGSRYGDYDLTWLLHALVVEPNQVRLAVGWKGVSAVVDYLQSRFHMYRNVYFHKVVRGAEGMFKLALQRARRLAIQGRLTWPPRDHESYKALVGQRLTMAEFTDLDDVSVLHCLKLWARGDDQMLAGICRGLLFRRLYKTIDLSQRDDAVQVTSRIADAIAANNGDPAYEMFFDQPTDTPYESDYCAQRSDAEIESGGQDTGISVLGMNGRLSDLSAVTPIPHLLNQQLMFSRIHVAPQWADLARQLID